MANNLVTIEIETECPDPRCKAGLEHLRVMELRRVEDGKLLDWHQRCTKCNTYFTQGGRWIEAVR